MSEWITIIENLPISTVAIMGLSYACWNIYKDTQEVSSRVLETNNQLSQTNAELVKTNSDIANANAQYLVLINDIQDKVNVIFDRVKHRNEN